jgi:hypothetical protein
VNEGADSGDDQDHHRGERIEPERERQVEIVGRNPGVERLLDRPRFRRHADQLPHRDRRHGKRRDHDQGGEPAGDGLGQPPSEQGVDEEAGEREERNQREHGITT